MDKTSLEVVFLHRTIPLRFTYRRISVKKCRRLVTCLQQAYLKKAKKKKI